MGAAAKASWHEGGNWDEANHKDAGETQAAETNASKDFWNPKGLLWQNKSAGEVANSENNAASGQATNGATNAGSSGWNQAARSGWKETSGEKDGAWQGGGWGGENSQQNPMMMAMQGMMMNMMRMQQQQETATGGHGQQQKQQNQSSSASSQTRLGGPDALKQWAARTQAAQGAASSHSKPAQATGHTGTPAQANRPMYRPAEQGGSALFAKSNLRPGAVVSSATAGKPSNASSAQLGSVSSRPKPTMAPELFKPRMSRPY